MPVIHKSLRGWRDGIVVMGILTSLACVAGCGVVTYDEDSQHPSGPYEHYALQTGRLHPEPAATLQPFFVSRAFAVEETVRIVVLDDWFGSLGIRGTPSAVGVFGNTIYVIHGVLDADGRVRGNNWSWTRPHGIALWAHEVFHVYQYQDKYAYVLKLLPGVIASWLSGQAYSHELIALEQEAMAFQVYVEQSVSQWWRE